MPITHPTERYQPCNVSDLDIGKYRDYDISVLCNGYSASAAELFVAALRDYGLADVVGEKTYGKGCAQDIIPLDMFGYSGALKLTTKLYYPPCGVGYDGEGITPDVEVSLSAEAKKYSIYKLPESLDDQLKAAIEALK
jgi:carboxyl-terminal processing protease